MVACGDVLPHQHCESIQVLLYTFNISLRPSCSLVPEYGEFQGLKAWREHMIARSMLRKRECLNAERARVGRRAGVNGRAYSSPP